MRSGPGSLTRRWSLLLRLSSPAVALAAGAAALALYLTTVARTLSWKNGGADAGDFITSAWALGIPHPPGYPTYTLLAHLFTRLPVGEVAFRVNLLSTVAGALAVGLIALAALVVCRRAAALDASGDAAAPGGRTSIALPPAAALIAALAFGTGTLFWSQTTVAEVYAPMLAALAAILVLLLRWRGTPDHPTTGQPVLASSVRPAPSTQQAALLCAALVLGLGLGLHLTLLAALPAGVLFALLARPPLRGRRGLALAAAAAVAFLAGTLIFAYLPVRAAQGPVTNWGDPQTPGRFLALVSAADYQQHLGRLPAERLAGRAGYVANLVLGDYTLAGFLLIVVGLWRALHVDRPFFAFGVVAAALNVAFAVAYPVRDSEVYLLPAFLMAACWLALGLDHAARAAFAALTAGGQGIPPVGADAASRERNAARRRHWRAAAVSSPFGPIALAALALAWFPGRAVALHHGDLSLAGDRTAAEYAQAVAQEAAPRALILTIGDEDTFSLWYWHYVQGLRPDAALVVRGLLRFPWYRDTLRRLYPDLALTESGDGPGAGHLVLLNYPARPAYATHFIPDAPGVAVVPVGKLYRLEPILP